MYDVLDAVAGQVSEGHLAKDLMKSQPWFSGVYVPSSSSSSSSPDFNSSVP